MMPCKACLHPDALSVDAALRAGESQRSVSRRFGLAKDTVRRHVDRDLAQPHAPGNQTPHEPTAAPTGEKSALDELRELVANLKATPLNGLSPTIQLAIAREKRLAVVELAKVLPPPVPNGGLDWSQSAEWVEFSCWWEDWMLTRDPTRALLNDWRAACHERIARGD